jgi:hypothetical protein
MPPCTAAMSPSVFSLECLVATKADSPLFWNDNTNQPSSKAVSTAKKKQTPRKPVFVDQRLPCRATSSSLYFFFVVVVVCFALLPFRANPYCSVYLFVFAPTTQKKKNTALLYIYVETGRAQLGERKRCACEWDTTQQGQQSEKKKNSPPR